MTAEDVGHRSPDGAYEWSVGNVEDKPLVMRHFAPDAIRHLYSPGEINEPILLYRGRFTILADQDAPDRACDGDIRLSWLPTPRIEVNGEYSPEPGHIEAFLGSGADSRIWHQRLQVRVPNSSGVPQSPIEEAPPWSREAGTAYLGQTEIYPPEIGDGAVLTKLTALIINGWDGLGGRVANPADRRQTWFGRATAHGGGWLLDMDALDPSREDLARLRRSGGYGATHTLSLQRADGSPFTSEDAMHALDAIRCALSLIVGRRADVVLPVGWHDDKPVWAWWTAGRVDSFQHEHGRWLDASIGGAQASEVIGRFLQRWPDELSSDTLRYATSYYVQALALGVELGTAAAVSGLLLLAYSWLVEEKSLYSKNAWEDLKPQAEKQIRALLQMSDCRINTAVPAAFDHLAAVAQQLNVNGQLRDGLGCVIKLRNDVIHPTRTKRTKWSAYQRAEAQNLAVHFLEMALLAYIGYRGQVHPRISDNRWLGYTEDVPWLGR
jgi:hypothetical protein